MFYAKDTYSQVSELRTLPYGAECNGAKHIVPPQIARELIEVEDI